ncbi:MAG: alpha/beta fold hydrolase [Burkholderiales bacterium]
MTSTGPANRTSGTKSTIVLVHGAWHGGWCWRRVVPHLQAAGHEVFAPTLTGLADRAHLLDRSIDLDTHIQDVIGLLEYEELSNVVLVGHSYAGAVITGVADRAASRLGSLVYLDAFLPANGKRMMDYIHSARREATINAGAANGFVDPPDAALFGLVPGTADMAWVTRRMTRHPFGTMSQPLRLDQGGGAHLQRLYIHCTKPGTGSFDQFANVLRVDPRWTFHEFQTGHDCMVLEPAETARLILSAA